MKKALLIISGLGVLGYGLYRYFKYQSKLLMEYSWKFVGLRIFKITFNEISLEIKFQFTSKANIQAKIEKMYFDLYIDGVNVGFISDTTPIIIPANGTSIVPLMVSINPKSVLGNIVGLGAGYGVNKDFKLKMDGYANIRSGFISVTLPITYEISLKEFLRQYGLIK
jgi:hypothetical protein